MMSIQIGSLKTKTLTVEGKPVDATGTKTVEIKDNKVTITDKPADEKK